MSSNMRVKKTCDHCGSYFVAKTTVTRYCGDPCAKKAYKQRMRMKLLSDAQLENEASKESRKIEYQEGVSHREYLSVKQAVDYLGVSRMTIHRKMKSGKLPYSRFGGRVLILKKDLDKLIRP